MLIAVAVAVFEVAAMWKMYVKAGQPGWGCIVPIYNMYLMCLIGGKPGWWLILFFIPVVNVIIQILVIIGIARNFGKGGGFAAGLIFLSPIFIPILGFGSAQYVGDQSVPPAVPAA
jgi:hypothetical protein